MLSVYTRHSAACPEKNDSARRRCRCPKWIAGSLPSRSGTLRFSAKTRSWEKAEQLARKYEIAATTGEEVERTSSLPSVKEAVNAYLADAEVRGLAEGTIEKLRQVFKRQLVGFADREMAALRPVLSPLDNSLVGRLHHLGSLFWWEWFARELPPLERYYLPAYFHSTENAKSGGVRTRIEPLFKTAPGKKRELVLTPDVVSGRDRNLPLQLSQSALEQGWTGIEKGPPIWDDSDAVEDFLRDDFYQRREFWQLVAEPMLDGCVFLFVSLAASFLFIRDELTGEWRDLLTALPESRSPLDYRIDLPAQRGGIMTRIGLRWETLKWIGKLASRPVNPKLQTRLDIVAKWDRASPSNRGDSDMSRFLTRLETREELRWATWR